MGSQNGFDLSHIHIGEGGWPRCHGWYRQLLHAPRQQNKEGQGPGFLSSLTSPLCLGQVLFMSRNCELRFSGFDSTPPNLKHQTVTDWPVGLGRGKEAGSEAGRELGNGRISAATHSLCINFHLLSGQVWANRDGSPGLPDTPRNMDRRWTDSTELTMG